MTSVERVPIITLVTEGSPRAAGESPAHTRLLAESHAELPPIVVHRHTMRVIDGFHRLRAAVLRGDHDIDVRFFDGSESEAFVLAVQTNVTHGLPLSLADRESAAVRIMTDFPSWSNRAIASATGLSASTVGAIRRRTATDDDTSSRLGRDGRLRPVNSSEGRLTASAIIRERPEASLREIARDAGISPATVRDVRARMQRGEDPVPAGRRTGNDSDRRQARSGGRPAAGPGLPPDTIAAMVENLRNDPALRFTESGRMLLRWLTPSALGVREWENVTPLIPPHCGYVLAKLARVCSEEWSQFAAHLEQQVDEMA